MNKKTTRRLAKAFSLALAALLLSAEASFFALHAHGEVLGKRNVDDKITLRSLIVSINDEVIYDSAQALPSPSVSLTPNSTMSFSLRWDAIGKGDQFREGDYFSIPVVQLDGLRLTEPFTQTLELNTGAGKSVAVAVGKFTYTDDLLAFEVVFNKNASNYQIEGGPAGGYAELSVSSGQTELPLIFGDDTTVTVDIDTEPGGVTPEVPVFPKELPIMQKAVFSPSVDGNTVNLQAKYPTIPPSGESKFGLDWRVTFFDLDSHFQGGGGATANVIIEDIVGEGQKFSNFACFASGDRDKGFSPINDENYEAPFFIEIPVVAVGSNRIYNLYGDDTLYANSSNGYIGTLIRANQLTQITGGDVEDRVRQKPLSWGVETLGDGREKLIINLGKLGPGVQKGQGLTADMVKEKDYPYAVVDGMLVKELLDAQRMIEAGGADANQWKRVRKESLATILHYWPDFKAKLCGIAGIPAGSTTEALEAALFAMTHDQLNRSNITTLGYDERHAGGIAGRMRIDGFVLRYRTVFSSVTDTDISNSAKVTTGIVNKEDSTDYHHQFYADIFGTVNAGEIIFVKADEADGYQTGEVTEEELQGIRGLADAEFELYEITGGDPLRFKRSGNVYERQEGGNVTILCSDSDGAFKITGLSTGKDYALYEKKAPAGFRLPAERYTIFRVSSSESTYFVITNTKGPGSPGTPDDSSASDTDRTRTSDGPSTPADSDTPHVDIPDSDVPLSNIPELGDNSYIQLALFMMIASAVLVVGIMVVSCR